MSGGSAAVDGGRHQLAVRCKTDRHVIKQFEQSMERFVVSYAISPITRCPAAGVRFM